MKCASHGKEEGRSLTLALAAAKALCGFPYLTIARGKKSSRKVRSSSGQSGPEEITRLRRHPAFCQRQESAHLLVGGLREVYIGIFRRQRNSAGGWSQTDNFIGLLAQGRACFGSAHWLRHNDAGRAALSRSSDRGAAHARSGSQAVIHEDHRFPRQFDCGPAVSVFVLPPLAFALLDCGDSCENRVSHSEACGAHPYSALSRRLWQRCAHRQLLVTGHSQLPDDENIQLRAESLAPTRTPRARRRGAGRGRRHRRLPGSSRAGAPGGVQPRAGSGNRSPDGLGI